MNKEDIIIDIAHIRWLMEYREEEARSHTKDWTNIDIYDLQSDCVKVQEVLDRVLDYVKKDE